MKRYNKLIIATLFATGALVTGCKKDFLSLEVNPNTPSVTTPQFALAGALKVAADIPNLNYNIFGEWGGFLTPSGNFVPSPAIQQYQFTTDNFQVFTGLYGNATNFDNIEKLGAADASLAKFQAIAKIMKVYDFQQLVDVYNNVPYTEAFQASTILFPKYDKGPAIYADLVVQLKAAITIIDASASATDPSTSDIVFKGDMSKWKRFANTLLLRLAIRQTNFASGQATALAALPAGDPEVNYVVEGFSVEANPGYTGSGAEGQQSPYWRSFGFDISGNPAGSSASVRANAYAVNKLKAYNDPRLGRYYAPTPNSLLPSSSGPAYTGIVFGDPNAAANASTSAMGPGLLKAASQNAVLMGAYEGLFLIAEAKARGYITTGAGTAQSYYERGITTSFIAVGLTAADAKAYYTPNPDPTIPPVRNINYVASTNLEQQVEAIITQKYLSLNGYSYFEAWNDFKRTGYPVGVPRSIDSKAIGTTIPNRIFFPTSEYQQNADNVGAEGTIDPFTSKIFWQK